MNANSVPVSIPKMLSLLARERRIEQGRDLETNLEAKLGRKPTLAELRAESIAECNRIFGREGR